MSPTHRLITLRLGGPNSEDFRYYREAYVARSWPWNSGWKGSVSGSERIWPHIPQSRCRTKRLDYHLISPLNFTRTDLWNMAWAHSRSLSFSKALSVCQVVPVGRGIWLGRLDQSEFRLLDRSGSRSQSRTRQL